VRAARLHALLFLRGAFALALGLAVLAVVDPSRLFAAMTAVTFSRE
jgi:hypothetical protein